MKKTIIVTISLAILISGIVFFGAEKKSLITIKNYFSDRCHQTAASYLQTNLPVPDRVTDLLGRMTDLEKIGQMVLVEKNSVQPESDIARYNLGALLSGGGAGPTTDNTPLSWLKMMTSFQSAGKNSCLSIPILYGIDAIHGISNVSGATIFPHDIALGATRDADLVRRVAAATAEEMAAVGINWNFAPNLDVAKDTRWGKTYETFGSDTNNTAQLGPAYLQGLQASSTGYFNVLATLKHFIGGGAMQYGTSRNKDFKIEEGNITLDEKNLRQDHLVPFQKAVAAGAQAVMVGTASWNGKINPANHYLLTDVLKKELNFSGFVVSDWYAIYEISPNDYDSLVIAVNAGVDMIMTPFDYKNLIANLQKALASGDISKERLNDAVSRILKAKFELGLFDRPEPNPSDLSVIGSSAHRELAREAVRQSQVLLKNKNTILPLSPSLKKIIVSGSSADNLGRQSGGWTTAWQGIDGNNGLVGTTILLAIKNTVSKNTEVEYNQAGDFFAKNNLADVGIVIVGEKPYAEGIGDNPNPSLTAEDLLTIEKTKAQSKKIIVVIVSGRPLNISAYSKNWDGIVVSWLPGSEGQGVADVLFGLYPFTGTLPVKWNY